MQLAERVLQRRDGLEQRVDRLRQGLLHELGPVAELLHGDPQPVCMAGVHLFGGRRDEPVDRAQPLSQIGAQALSAEAAARLQAGLPAPEPLQLPCLAQEVAQHRRELAPPRGELAAEKLIVQLRVAHGAQRVLQPLHAVRLLARRPEELQRRAEPPRGHPQVVHWRHLRPARYVPRVRPHVGEA